MAGEDWGKGWGSMRGLGGEARSDDEPADATSPGDSEPDGDWGLGIGDRGAPEREEREGDERR